MRNLGQKLVNHQTFTQSLGSKIKTAAEIAGTVQTAVSAGKVIAPYVMQAIRIGTALL